MKLPKEMQNKAKSRPKRPQPTKGRDGKPQLGSRQMRRKMAQQGIDMDQIDATRVVIETTEKALVIEQPEVILMKQAGQEIYQIIGSAEEQPLEKIIAHKNEEAEIETEIEEDLKPTITEVDIMLVAAQANVDKEEAETTLIECKGDIAKAILFLKNR